MTIAMLLTERSMKFYIARFKHPNGDRSHPWSLFAANTASALDRINTMDGGEFSQVEIHERPVSEVSHYRNDATPNDLVLEHPNHEWRPE
jgi:hypothetical protein